MRAVQEFKTSRRACAAAVVTLLVASLVVSGGGIANADQGSNVVMPDPALRACVNRELQNAPDAEITEEQMRDLRELACLSPDLTDLSGLEAAQSLASIVLIGGAGPVIDLGPLSGLVQLSNVTLLDVRINDLSPLQTLPTLSRLEVTGASITDISALSQLAGLKFLSLQNNQIAEVSPLAALTSLDTLLIDRNNVLDLSPLSPLTGTHISAENQTYEIDTERGEQHANPVKNRDGNSVPSEAYEYNAANDSYVFEHRGVSLTTWQESIPGSSGEFSGEILWNVAAPQVQVQLPIPAIVQATTNADGTINEPKIIIPETEGVVFLQSGMSEPGETVQICAIPLGDYVIDFEALPEGWAVNEEFYVACFVVVFDEAAPYTGPVGPVKPTDPSGANAGGLVATGAESLWGVGIVGMVLLAAGTMLALRRRA